VGRTGYIGLKAGFPSLQGRRVPPRSHRSRPGPGLQHSSNSLVVGLHGLNWRLHPMGVAGSTEAASVNEGAPSAEPDSDPSPSLFSEPRLSPNTRSTHIRAASSFLPPVRSQDLCGHSCQCVPLGTRLTPRPPSPWRCSLAGASLPSTSTFKHPVCLNRPMRSLRESQGMARTQRGQGRQFSHTGPCRSQHSRQVPHSRPGGMGRPACPSGSESPCPRLTPGAVCLSGTSNARITAHFPLKG
jgi:hypothetical protein